VFFFLAVRSVALGSTGFSLCALSVLKSSGKHSATKRTATPAPDSVGVGAPPPLLPGVRRLDGAASRILRAAPFHLCLSLRLLYPSPPHPACSVRRVRRLGLARTLVESTLEDENGDGSPMSKKSDSKSNNGGGNAHQRRQAKRHPQSPDVEPAQQHALGEALSPVPSSERNPTPEPARSGWAHVRQVLGGCFVLSRS